MPLALFNIIDDNLCQNPQRKLVLFQSAQLVVLQRPLAEEGVAHFDEEVLHEGDLGVFEFGWGIPLLVTGTLGAGMLFSICGGGWLSLQNRCQGLRCERATVVAPATIPSCRAGIRSQNPASITIHDYTEQVLMFRAESERSNSSTDVDIADMRRRRVAEVAWIRDWGLVFDESFGIP